MKLLTLSILALLLTSCGMTQEEITQKKKWCEENQLTFSLWEDPFGAYAKCEAGDNGNERNFSQVDLDQIKYCRDKGLNFERSGWDSNIKCVSIE